MKNANFYFLIRSSLLLIVSAMMSPVNASTECDALIYPGSTNEAPIAKRTTFDPAKHGFQYTNDFQTQIDIAGLNGPVFGGLCGGMVYTALDYFLAKKTIPKQTFRPATGTDLYNYIYDRQSTSTFSNLDKWTELFVNPFGWRTDEFFNWGLQGKQPGDRMNELKSEIDKGRPVPLGLFQDGNGGTGPHHQVLAIGYDYGRYKGDLGQYISEFKIFIYDPNHKNQTLTLVADPANKRFYYKEKPGYKWLTYFVDKKYALKQPTVNEQTGGANDKLVRKLQLEFETGGDDLRGGNDNVNVTLRLKDGSTQSFPNINKGKRWIDNYKETVQVTLNKPVPLSALECVIIKTTFGGGMGGDNWNMNSLRVVAFEGNTEREVFRKGGSPLVRFTGSNTPYEAVLRI